MAKKAAEMSSAEVAAIVKAGEPGKYAVGGRGAPTLIITPKGACSWAIRLRVDGKSTDRRLGGYAARPEKGALTLAQARDAAAEMRVDVARGVDPVAQRRAQREVEQKAAEAAAGAKTFEQMARETFETVCESFKNEKHRQQWIGTLEAHVFPTLGDRPIDSIRVPDVAAVLRPIWRATPETARRVRQRMDRVFRFAMAHEATSTNPVPAVDDLLPAQDARGAHHHPALPVGEIPRFMAALRAADGMGARALEFAILTAARSIEVRGARLREIDAKAALWNVPRERMKRKRPHTVPLSDDAMALLKALPAGDQDDLIFGSEQPGSEGAQMSDMTLLAVVRRLHEADVAAGGKGFLDTAQRRDGKHPIATPHGIARSSFRDWCSETGVPGEIAEAALAHSIKDKTEAAYRRTTLVEQRRPVMEAWAQHCAGCS